MTRLTGEQYEELAHAVGVRGSTTLGYRMDKRRLDALAELIELWMSYPPPGWTETRTISGRTVWIGPWPQREDHDHHHTLED